MSSASVIAVSLITAIDAQIAMSSSGIVAARLLKTTAAACSAKMLTH